MPQRSPIGILIVKKYIRSKYMETVVLEQNDLKN